VRLLAVYNKAQARRILQETESRVATFHAETCVMSHQSLSLSLSLWGGVLCVCMYVCVCVCVCVSARSRVNRCVYVCVKKWYNIYYTIWIICHQQNNNFTTLEVKLRKKLTILICLSISKYNRGKDVTTITFITNVTIQPFIFTLLCRNKYVLYHKI